MTTPELSQLLSDAQDCYHISILALPELDARRKVLTLHLNLFLVNKNEIFPCLTLQSPSIVAWPLEPGIHVLPGRKELEQGEEEEEEGGSMLNRNIRSHRRKLGYGSLSSPSSGSLVISPIVIGMRMEGLQVSCLSVCLYRLHL